MKILIATDNYYPNVNGAAYFAQRLAFQLKANGNEVLVLAPSRKLTDEIFEHEGVKIAGIGSLPLERIRVVIPLLKRRIIYRTIKQFGPDIVHIQSHFAISRKAAESAIALGIPVVGTNHFMPENLVHYLKPSKTLEKYLIRMLWRYFLKTFNKLNGITTPTQTAAKLISNIGLTKKIRVISNGIDLQKFNPKNNGDYLKVRYKIPDRKILLFVGRLDKEKNLDFVIRTFKNVLDKTKIQLVLTGVGAEYANLSQLVKNLNIGEYVTFTGFISDEDLPNLYPLASCFVMAGTAELQSIATMEAMASGLPVLAANAMALPELVAFGENGFLFDTGDKANLANYIVKIFTEPDLQRKMSETSLRKISKHELPKVIGQFESFYQEQIKTLN